MKTITFDETKWKLVPVEPTKEMLEHGHQEIDFDRNDQNTHELVHESHINAFGGGTTIEQDMRDAWAVMLAAAPAAPSQPAVPQLPERETKAMHDAVMSVLYKGVTRMDTDKLWQAYRAVLLAATPAAPSQESKCAQCHKPYRKGVDTKGCPKCAPGVDVPESEFQKPISAPSQPLTDEVFRPIVKAVFDAGWATCRASELVGDNAKEFAWDMYGDELTERLIAAIPATPSQESVTLTDEQRQQVLRDAENRMMRDINLSWRNAVVDEVERAIAALREKQAKATPCALIYQLR